jgi:hypothetical protein
MDMPLAQAPVSAFDDAQRAHFAAHGWVAAPGFFTAEEAAEIGAWTDELASRPERPGAHWVYREPSLTDPSARVIQRIERFAEHHDGFARLMRGSRLERAAGELLGGEAVLFKDKINLKMPGGAGFEPHQDQQAGWSAYAPMFVTGLVCLDPATVENGCLEMADAPRLGGLIGEEWTPLTLEQMQAFRLIPAPTLPGDVLFFDSYAPHASKPNLTATQRRILYLTWNLAADGDHRDRYYADKHANFPPDVEREAGKDYRFRV